MSVRWIFCSLLNRALVKPILPLVALGLCLTSLVSSPASASEVATDSPGKGLFTAVCALCHQLPDPAQFKIEQWRRVLEVMKLRMEQKKMPPLSEADQQEIFKYLSENARK